MHHVLSNMSIIVGRRIDVCCLITYVYHVSYAYLLIFKNYQIFMFLPICNFFSSKVCMRSTQTIGYLMFISFGIRAIIQIVPMGKQNKPCLNSARNAINENKNRKRQNKNIQLYISYLIDITSILVLLEIIDRRVYWLKFLQY